MIKNEYTVLLYSKSDAKKYVSDNFSVGKIFPLTPDAKSVIINVKDIPIIDPIKIFSSYSHLRVSASTRQIEKKITTQLVENNSIPVSARETFLSLLHIYLNSFHYIWYLVKNTGPWIIFDGKKWIKEESKSIVCKILYQRIVSEKKGVFSFGQNNNQIAKKSIRLINNITLSFLKNKKIIFTTGNDYGLQNIINQIHNYDKKIKLVTIDRADKGSILISLKSLLSALFSTPQKLIKIPPVQSEPESNKILLEKLFSTVSDKKINPVKDFIIKSLDKAISYTQSIINDTDKIMKSLNPEAVIAHHVRWLEASVIAECSKKNKIETILISHGTHSYPLDSISEYESGHLARGLLTSKLSTLDIAQSPIAEKAMKFFSREMKYENYQPIMWGHKKIQKSNNQKDFTILSAGTFKQLCCRPRIYESSNEFIFGLINLINCIDKIKNCKLIISVRNNHECELSSLKSLLPKSNCYEIKTDFYQELKKADLLVSYSSTTIEEALNLKIPVALFGGTNKYRHIHSSDIHTKMKRQPIYYLDNKNISKLLPTIIKKFRGNPLKDRELRGLVWQDSVPGLKTLLAKIIS